MNISLKLQMNHDTGINLKVKTYINGMKLLKFRPSGGDCIIFIPISFVGSGSLY